MQPGGLTAGNLAAIEVPSTYKSLIEAKTASLFETTTGVTTMFASVQDTASLQAVIGSGGTLDKLEDAAEESVSEAINAFLNVNLVKDGAKVTEGQSEFVKGNLLANDTGLPAGLGVTKVSVGTYAVDGTAVPDFIRGSAADPNLVGNSYSISTSDLQAATVGAGTLAEQLGFAGLMGAGSGFLATAGSAIKLQLTVQAGQTLTFDYKFGSFDYLPWNDYSFVSLKKVGAASTDDGVRTLYDVRDLKGPQLFKDAGVWKINNAGKLTYTFKEAGTYTLGVGSTDVGDTIFDTVLTVQNIRLDGVLVAQQAQEFGNVDLNAAAPVLDVSALVLLGKYGTLIVTKSGDYLYQPGKPGLDANVDNILAGQTAEDAFTYIIQLPNGKLATQKLTFDVLGTEFRVILPPPTLRLSPTPTVHDGRGRHECGDQPAGQRHRRGRQHASVTAIAGTTLTPGTAQSIAVANGTVNVSAQGR